VVPVVPVVRAAPGGPGGGGGPGGPAGAARPVDPFAPHPIRGQVVSVGEDAVVLKQADGSNLTVAMGKGWTVSRPRKSTVAEVAVGDFVASASKDTGPDQGVANEMRVMESGYRPEYGTHGVGAPGASMTHGFVFGVAPATGGTKVTVAYPQGKRDILLPEGMAVTVSDLLPRSVLKPGVAVGGVTRPGKDGVQRAARLTLAE